MPAAAGDSAVYRFTHAPVFFGGIRLTSITAPNRSQTTRFGYAGMSTGFPDRRITEIIDVDQDTVRFTYAGNQRIRTRKDKRGFTATYLYDATARLKQSSLPAGISHQYEPAETKGLTVSVADTSVFTRYDGPRTDSADVSLFWLDQFWAPRKIQDPHGNTTVLERNDPEYGALVTRIEHPPHPGGQRVVTASYDARGNLESQTEVAPYGAAQGDATTTYEWDAKWDFVTRITQPEGEQTQSGYDPANGNRLWIKPTGDASRADTVKFRYYAGSGLLRAVDEPLTPADSLLYDTRGNLRATRSGLGFHTLFDKDALGRDTLVVTPIDSAAALTETGVRGSGMKQRLVYDAMDRVKQDQRIGPEMNTVGQQTLTVDNLYDDEGNLTRLTRSMSPNPTGIQPLVTQWQYDGAGRPVVQTHPDGKIDSTYYDPASNVVKHATRRLDASGNRLAITMTYDARNRMTRRTLPQVDYPARSDGLPSYGQNTPHCDDPDDPLSQGLPITHTYPLYPNDGGCGYRIAASTEEFGYDAMGNLLRADNEDARVRRSYHPGGQLHRDSSYVQTLARDDWAAHPYGVTHSYDLNGRPVGVTLPTQLNGGTVAYGYDGVTGHLAQVTDPLSNTFDLKRDVQGRVDMLLLPLAATPVLQQQRYEYDADSRLDRYELRLRPEVGGLIESTTLRFDARDKLLRSANANGGQELRTADYSGLGHVVESSQSTTGTTQLGSTVVNNATTTYRYDPLGNSDTTTYQSSSGSSSGYSWSERNSTARYHSTSGRLVRVQNGSQAGDRDTLFYDAAGNRVFQTRSGMGAGLDRASFYAADGRLKAADTRTVGDLQAPASVETVTFEEYRYDALGRRVRTRTRNWCQGSNNDGECSYDFVRRTVWNGEQTLGQIRMPDTDARREWDGFPIEEQRIGNFDPNPHLGQVIYTHGTGIDQPLSVMRMGYGDHVPGDNYRTWTPFAVFPLWDPEGGAPYAVFADGTREHCLPNSTRCLDSWWRLAWLPYAGDKNAFVRSGGIDGETVWLGNLNGRPAGCERLAVSQEPLL